MSHLVPWSTRKKLLVGAAAGTSAAAAGYLVYRFWLKGYLEKQWSPVYTSASSVWRVLEVAGMASDLSGTVLSDLKDFLDSDADEVPRSVRQMLKLTRSPEFQQAVLTSTQSLTEGVAAGVGFTTEQAGRSHAGEVGSVGQKGLVGVVLEKLFTEEGKGFASAVCSRMVRTLVASLQSRGKGDSPRHGYSAQEQTGEPLSQQQTPWIAQLIDALSTDRGKDLLTSIIQTFAVSGIGTFLDKTADVNMYHDILAACGRHPALVKDLSAHVISTTVRETMHSWRSGAMGPDHQGAPSDASSSSCSSPRAGLIPMSTFSESDSDTVQSRRGSKAPGMAVEFAQCLAQPEVRSMILDVTGVMTTKGMEAFLLVLMYKMFGGSPPYTQQIADAPRDEILVQPMANFQRGRASVQSRILVCRALAAASVCLAIVLHQVSM